MGVHLSILVVEDDLVVRTAVCALLERLGHAYTEAASCGEAKALLAERAFACSIIDLGLPDGNGLSLVPIVRQCNPCCTPIILTADARPETIVETMRAGVFDYLVKPVDFTTFQAALGRALHHHEVTRERDELLKALAEERDLLRTRVAEATADLRRHASHIELVNIRQEVLLQLNRLPEEAHTEEALFRSLFDKLAPCVPLHCVALATTHSRECFIAVTPAENGRPVVVTAEPSADNPAAEMSDGSGTAYGDLAAAVESHLGLDTSAWQARTYPQGVLGRLYCTVGFFLPRDFEADAECDAFLAACAGIIASKWQEMRLFHYAARRASVGNLALDISREMVQMLTAIRTAADVVMESGLSQEGMEGMAIINENVEHLRQQLKELRILSSPQRNTVETVHLEHFVDQALDFLAGVIEQRGIVINKDFHTSSECVLFNGAALARTFLDLITSAVRSVENGRQVCLRLRDNGADTVLFEVSYDGLSSELFGVARRVTDRFVPAALWSHPKFIMAQRTIRGCGGTLTIEHKMEGWCAFSVILPRNALSSTQELEEIGVS